MITINSWAEFRADFPDDAIEDDTDIVQFGGRNVAEAIAEILRSLGCTVSEPTYADLNGWHLYLQFKSASMWAQVTSLWPHTVLMLKDEPPVLFSRSNTTLFAHVLGKLHEELVRDGRFHDIAWHPDHQFDIGGGGSPTPVVGEIGDVAAVKGRRGLLSVLFGPRG